MIEAVVLDTGPLGELTNPRCNPRLAGAIRRLVNAGGTVFIPEIADYELRRNLILERMDTSVGRLDLLEGCHTYVPVDTRMMRRAAQMWAEMRKRGKPTADSKALDGDVILVAQAEAVNAPILTENAGHLSRMWSTLDCTALAEELGT